MLTKSNWRPSNGAKHLTVFLFSMWGICFYGSAVEGVFTPSRNKMHKLLTKPVNTGDIWVTTNQILPIFSGFWDNVSKLGSSRQLQFLITFMPDVFFIYLFFFIVKLKNHHGMLNTEKNGTYSFSLNLTAHTSTLASGYFWICQPQ